MGVLARFSSRVCATACVDRGTAVRFRTMSCCDGKECTPADGGATTLDEVKEYYGKVLSTSKDLKTDACTSGAKPRKDVREVLRLIHDEVLSKFYGCGLTVPMDRELEGLRILDLGSGSGRDCFILSKMVGPNGYVVGVDMTEEQVAVAQKYVPYHTEKFGYEKPNVEFKHGFIERLDEAGIEPGSFDLVISNCVVNLSPDKAAVFEQTFKALKPGGEMYFSDVYSDRRISEALRKDKVLWGECLSGALYWKDFYRVARKAGFADPRVVSSGPMGINNEQVEAVIGHVNFYSTTLRLFKIDALEDACEDFGQAVRYNGTCKESPKELTLDQGHVFPAGKIVPVCGNTFLMLQKTRLEKHFTFYGDFSTHYGIFEGCGESNPFETPALKASDDGGCC